LGMLGSMKIGLLTSELGYHNGWAHYSYSLIRALQQQGIEVVVMAAHNADFVPDVDVHTSLPTVTPPDRGTLLRMIRVMPRLRHLFHDCDVIHSTVEIYAPLAAAVAGTRPFFITLHGSYANMPRMRRWPVSWLYQWAFQQGHLVCVSEYTARVARSVVPDAKTLVVNNGVDSRRFAHLPIKTSIPQSPLIISVGGVKFRKGTIPLIRAIAEARAVWPQIRCAIIGGVGAEPHYVQHTYQVIEQLALQDHVQLTGFVDDATLMDYFEEASLFVLPALNAGWKFEGFGLAYLEAGAAGLPVIGTRDCGAEEAIDEGVTGLLVQQQNHEQELPQAILTILAQPDLAAQMGTAGRHKAQRQSWQNVAQEMQTIYAGVLKTARV